MENQAAFFLFILVWIVCFGSLKERIGWPLALSAGFFVWLAGLSIAGHA